MDRNRHNEPMDRNRWYENDRQTDGNRGREYPPAYGNRWRDNDRPVEGNWSRNNGENRKLEANITPYRRTGSHPRTYHRQHGKLQDYHYGWSRDGRRMQDGRSNNRHHPGEIAHSITHDSGKSSDYR